MKETLELEVSPRCAAEPWNASPARLVEAPCGRQGFGEKNPEWFASEHSEEQTPAGGKKGLWYAGTDAGNANGFTRITPDPRYRIAKCSFHPTAWSRRMNHGGGDGVLAWPCLSVLEDLLRWWDHCWLRPRQMTGTDKALMDCLPGVITAKLWHLATAFCVCGARGNAWEALLPGMQGWRAPPWLGEWRRGMKCHLPSAQHPEGGQCWPQPSLWVLALRV